MQAVRLAATGHHTYAEIARIVGRSVTTLQKWFARLEQKGLPSLLRRGHGGGKPSPLHAPRVRKALDKGLRDGRWLTAPQLAAWLDQEHGIKMESQRLYYWLRKSEWCSRCRAPSTSKRTKRTPLSSKRT